MKQLVLVVLIAFLVCASCSKQENGQKVLRIAAQRVAAEPDSVFLLLDGIDPQKRGWSRDDIMEYTLLRTRAANSSLRPLPSDTAFREVVSYYDSHGSSFQRVLAHYLLGSIYRDQGEMPQALSCFYEAVTFADTLDKHCDFDLLSRVYGQIGMALEVQYMPDEAIEAFAQSGHFALLAGDTLQNLLCMEQTIASYYSKSDTAKVLEVTDRCVRLNKQFGLSHRIPQVGVSAMYVYMEQGKYAKAGRLIRDFEEQSGLFDASGHIAKGYEHFYYLKGWHLSCIGQLDSAERYFRALLPFGYEIEAYKGLLDVYGKREKPDSVMTFAALYVSSVERLLSKTNTEAAMRVKGMYDYSRYQKTAEESLRKAQRAKQGLLTLTLSGTLLIAGFCVGIYLYRKKKEAERLAMEGNYEVLYERLNKAKKELEVLTAAMQTVNADKNKEIEELRTEVSHLQEAYSSLAVIRQREIGELQQEIDAFPKMYHRLYAKDKETELMDSDIVRAIKRKALPQSTARLLSAEEADRLVEVTTDRLPLFGEFLSSHELTKTEMLVCVLIRLNFSNNEICFLLDSTPQAVSNLKARSNNKMFGDSRTADLAKRIKNMWAV